MAEAIVTAAGMRIVRLLVGHPPQSITELTDSLGVTRTAVTEVLSDLEVSGFVEKTMERLPGRGRPRHVYRATDAALLLLFANNQRLIMPAIWKAIEDIGGEELTQEITRRASSSLAAYYRKRITATAPAQRLRQLVDVMAEEGALVEVGMENGHVVMRRRSCSFASLYDPKGTVCSIDETLLSETIGCPVRRTECRHEGNPCCAFEIVQDDGDGAEAQAGAARPAQAKSKGARSSVVILADRPV
jgi:DeoR family transcriptional regulator, suf operon transcriptional repressor